MIFPAECPLEAACVELRALYVALNSPVLRQDPLPVGPASAAVALHTGVPGVSVAIRSVRTGQVAYFTSDRDSPPTAQMAADAALSFGEALGFVFDDDEVAPDGAGGDAAARLWCELIGEDYEEAAVARAQLESPEGIQRIEVAQEEGVEGDDTTVREILRAAVNPARDPGQVLSKFRWSSGPIADAPTAERRTA